MSINAVDICYKIYCEVLKYIQSLSGTNDFRKAVTIQIKTRNTNTELQAV
jgi:hypothetical protein